MTNSRFWNQALLISTILNISRGQTTLETLKFLGKGGAKRYICKPSDRLDDSQTTFGEVFAVDWNERIYDLGFRGNWRTILAKGGSR